MVVHSPERGLRSLRGTGAHRRGAKERGEHGEPISVLTKARAVECRPSDHDEAVVAMELNGGGARAQREGENERGRCGEWQQGSPPFIWVVRW
jgi:hypothetical protein